MKKAPIAWITVGAEPAYPVWCLWLDDALYVVSGGAEQPAPGLDAASTVTVTARGDHNGRIVTWRAHPARVLPGSEEWETVVPQLAAKRLNGPPAAQLTERWAAGSALIRLAPDGDPTEAAGTMPDGSLAAPPRPSPAVRETAPPFRLHRVRRR